MLLADRFMPSAETEPKPASTADTAQVIAEETPSEVEKPQLALGVAVLPFTNMSEDANNAFFAGGVHEDVLTHLSRIADLRVISRTSMLKIAEMGLDIRQIGEQLGVSHVLEGSVRRAGDQVRVTVQLIDASNDNHLWADNFDRKLDDIFAIQSEIAQQIAAQLETELSAEQVQQMAEAPTKILEAYDLYQKARDLNRVWLDVDGFRQQIPLLEKALVLDPNFKAAQVDLVGVYGRMVWTGFDPEGIYREKSTQLVNQIVQKYPNQTESDLAQGKYFYTVERDYEKALEFYLKVLPHQPGNTELLLGISSCYKRLAQYDLGLPMIDRAISLDPQHPSMHSERGFHLLGNYRPKEALEHFKEGVKKFPEDLSNRFNLAVYSMREAGDIDTYFEQMTRIEQLSPRTTFLDSQYFRLNLPNMNLESVLEELDEPRDETSSWKNMVIDHQAAELLVLANREQESTAKARNALSAIQELLGAGQPLPGNTPKMSYALFAKIACLAGDRTAFNLNQSVFRAVKATEISGEYVANQLMAFALAECGETQAGWELMRKAMHPALGNSVWEIVLDPIYSHYFSDIPEFQALVKKKNAEKAASL